MQKLFPRRFVRWLDTDLSYLIKSGGWTGIGQVFGTFMGLATAYAFANYLPQDAYGTYKYVLATIALLSIPTLSGLNTVVVQAIAQHADGTAWAAMRRKFSFGLLSTAGGLCLGGYYFFNHENVLGWAFTIAAFVIPVMESLSAAQAVLIGKKRFDIAARQTILTSLLSATAVITAIILTRNPLWIIGAYLGATLIGRLVTFLVSRRFIENTTVSLENLRFGMHMSAVAVLGIIAGNVDMFLLWHTATAQTLALYAFALATVSPFQSLIKTVLNLVQPKFATQTPDQLRYTVPRRAHQTLLLLIPLIATAIIALPWLYELLFPNYSAAVPFAQVLMLSAALYSEKFYGIALITMRQTKAMYTLNTINTAVKIGLLAVLIPLFGGWGAVAAILSQNVIAILVTRYFFYRHALLNSPPA